MKSKKPNVTTNSKNPKAEKKQIPKASSRLAFLRFVTSGENKKYLLAGFIIGIIYFIILRILFPVPSYYSDSYTYIQAARDKYPISFRPIQYSEIINFFKNFSTSDVALIAGQYFSNVLANLLLFFSWVYFFPLRKVYKLLLFFFLICNPLYVFYSNYILTDAFFSSLTVAWFVILIWTIHKPAWYYIVIQLLLLVILFKLRYNAIVFPVFMAIALFFSKQAPWKKLTSTAVSFLLIGILVSNTSKKTETFAGTRTFSAFSGWQLANNALHILRTEKIDSAAIEDEEVRNILNYMQGYFDTTTAKIDSSSVTASYMWSNNSPLKGYLLNRYMKDNSYFSYFEAWTSLGPIYNRFGRTVILKKPFSYIQNFVVPNGKDYFIPPLEAYETYCADADTLNPITVTFYNYKTNKIGDKHPAVYTTLFKPWRYIFGVINILFLILAVIYLVLKRYKTEPVLFNKTLLCFSAFYLFNFFFVIALAPTVFRYHLFIVTLLFPFIFQLINHFSSGLKTTPSKVS
ncbi:MAG TPA: hypothetical protein VF622_09465 [Segetibacter sp.]|jgi:hypothetical protein